MAGKVEATIGRIVHFTLGDGETQRPAIVNDVAADGSLELHVFLSQADDGVDFKKVLPMDRNTTCDIHGAARGVKEGSIGDPGTWHWPPMGKPVVVDC